MLAEDASGIQSSAPVARALREAIDAERCVHTHVLEGKRPSDLPRYRSAFCAVVTRVVYVVHSNAVAAMPDLKLTALLDAGLDKIGHAASSRCVFQRSGAPGPDWAHRQLRTSLFSKRAVFRRCRSLPLDIADEAIDVQPCKKLAMSVLFPSANEGISRQDGKRTGQ